MAQFFRQKCPFYFRSHKHGINILVIPNIQGCQIFFRMPWTAPFKDKGKVGVGDGKAGEGSSGGQCSAIEKKSGKSGGKVAKIPKVTKRKESSKKRKSKPSIDGLKFSNSPVKMKKVSLRGKPSYITEGEDDPKEEEGFEMKDDREKDSFAKAFFNVVGDDGDDLMSSGSVVVENENPWLGGSQVKLKSTNQN